MVGSADAPPMIDFETGVLGAMLAGSIAPLVVLAIAAAAFSNEVEDSTLAESLTVAAAPMADNRAEVSGSDYNRRSVHWSERVRHELHRIPR